MSDTATIQGRQIGPQERAQVQALLAEHPDWSRHRISRQLATLWEWRNPAGQLKDMAARSLLLKLERRSWVQLPPRRWPSPNRMRDKAPPPVEVCEPAVPLTGVLDDLLPLNKTSP